MCLYLSSILTSNPLDLNFSTISERPSLIDIPANSLAIGMSLPRKSIICSFSRLCLSAISKSVASCHGVMTITPWHDATDFDIAERHSLEKEQIIDFRGKLMPIAKEFAGISIKEGRSLIVEKFRSKGLLVKIDDRYKHIVKKCYKCESLIEPQIKEQWFIKMKPLAEPAIKAIENGEIEYIPEHYKKISLHWLKNILDWNISRQIVWGIPIPAKVCVKCDEGVVDIENKVSACPKCGGELRQETDTFDTWFSSGQWPFASLGFPDSKDYKTFFPTDVMETAGEII